MPVIQLKSHSKEIELLIEIVKKLELRVEALEKELKHATR